MLSKEKGITMKCYELETKNGRTFRVAINNDSQEQRLLKKVNENKGKYEEFVRVEVVMDGIHDIKDFEKLADSLQ